MSTATANGADQARANGASQTETAFPVDDFKSAAAHLRRPFTAEAVRFKVQATWGGNIDNQQKPTGGLVVTYIDARLVSERLNLVCPHLWSDEYEAVGDGGLMCLLTVDSITRRDVGSGYKGKGLYSDAFKRAGVKFGIGVSLYATPKIFMKQGEHMKHRRTKDGWTLELTDAGVTECRRLYSAWLDAAGEGGFGKPLDHGVSENAAGDYEAEQPEREKPTPQPASTGPAEPEADRPPVVPPEAALAEFLATESPLAEKRAEAAKGMKLLGAPEDQQLRELKAADDKRALDALLNRIGVALDGRQS